jgi:hypothetical protein
MSSLARRIYMLRADGLLMPVRKDQEAAGFAEFRAAKVAPSNETDPQE